MLITQQSASLFTFFLFLFCPEVPVCEGTDYYEVQCFWYISGCRSDPQAFFSLNILAFSRGSFQTWISEMSEFLMWQNYFQLHSSFFCSYLNEWIDFPAVLPPIVLHTTEVCTVPGLLKHWDLLQVWVYMPISKIFFFFFFSCVQLPSLWNIRS